MGQKNFISFKVNSISDVWEIHQSVIYDVPDIFFVKNIKASYNSLLQVANVYPEYRFDEETRKNIVIQMEQTANVIIGRIGMLSEKEKIKQLHDYLVRSVTYRDVDAPYSHEAPGALLYGIGVCEGISKAFKFLADRLNIDSIVAIGDADAGRRNDDETGHAWNIVYIEGVPYHLDITFDYSVSRENTVRYDYYLLADSQIRVDHTFDNLPRCEVLTEYYEEIGYVATSKSRLEMLVSNELQPNKELIFKVSDMMGEKKRIVDSVMKVIENVLPIKYAMGYNIIVSYNLARMIFQVKLQRGH